VPHDADDQHQGAYDPRARRVSFFSPALGIARSFYIYIPPDLPPGARAPAVYLLRGHEREWINAHEDTSRAGRTVIDAYLHQRARGAIGPLILVFPGLSSDDNRVPSLLINMRAPHLAGASGGIGSGRFADFFFDELITYVDRHFPTIAQGRARGILGFSLGGAMAVRAAALHPELFAAAAAYDGTFLYATGRGRGVRRRDRVIANPMFDPAYGVPRDPAFIAANNPPNIFLRGDARALATVTWAIAYGPQEREPWQANYYRGEHLLACMHARGIPNALPHAALPDGEHSWRVADSFAERVLPIMEAALRRSYSP
jgi:pimeloyl-ACP methyl ester carboxylesterase